MTKTHMRVTLTLDFEPNEQQKQMLTTRVGESLQTLMRSGILLPNQESWKLLGVDVVLADDNLDEIVAWDDTAHDDG